jgi:hypothetical protein
VAGDVSTSTQYKIGGNRVLSTPGGSNAFGGVGAGAANTTGSNNTFFGSDAGVSNNTQGDNSFFGHRAGRFTTVGSNSFFGASAGENNSTGGSNSFFGINAGFNNTTGNFNAFFGVGAGQSNTSSANNSFFGANAGNVNVTGSNQTVIGANADVGANNLSNATAVGSRALVEQSNSLVLGSINGVNGATADTSVGIGTTTPASKLEVFNGVVTSSGPSGGRFLTRNPNNQSALVQLDWFNDGTHDWRRIRYGGLNEGAVNGLLIQGLGDDTKLAVLNNGNVGVGITSPANRLHVVGESEVFGAPDPAEHVAFIENTFFGNGQGMLALKCGRGTGTPNGGVR